MGRHHRVDQHRAELVPLCTLRAGENFRVPGSGAIVYIEFQSPLLARLPAGQLMVEPVVVPPVLGS